MLKSFTCIECPKGCKIVVNFEGDKIHSLEGQGCKKGKLYAEQEILSPKRILTSTVKAQNLELKFIPVKTSAPIPKSKIFEAMNQIKKIVINKPVNIGEIIVKDFVVEGINLVATRTVRYMQSS